MTDMEKSYRGWVKWILLYLLLLEAIQQVEATLQFAGKGESILMLCPYQNVQSWQKLETQDILASCENGMPLINSTISKRISITESCNILTINNFTEIDVGLYRCYVFDKSTTKAHDFNITILIKPHVSVITIPNPPEIKRRQNIKLLCNDKSGNNGNIDTFVWYHDGQLLVNKTNILTFENADLSIAGEYKCTARNVAGTDSAGVKIIVKFSPVVQNETVVFKTSNRPRTIKCHAVGVPDTYTYNVWLHYTYSNQLVRSLDGQGNGTLILPNNDTERLMYEDCGIYICNVTNNISDEYGRLWQVGNIKVIVSGKPVLATPQKHIHIGHVNKSSTINILILSSSNVSQAIWFNTNGQNHVNKSCSLSMIKTEFHGLVVTVSGYTCDLYIQNTQEADFQSYAVEIYNKYGKLSFETSLISARQPNPPQDVKVIALKLEIIVTWKSGRSDGLHTIFFVEYRKRFQLQWSIFPAESKTSVVIDGLQMDTIFYVRLFARTISGDSNRTDVVIVQTGWHHVVSPYSALEINVITGAAVVILLICLCGMKAHTLARRYCFNTAQRRNNQSQGNETSIRNVAQYDEIDSVYYTPASMNDRPQLTINHSTLGIQPSTSHNRRTFENVVTDRSSFENSNNNISMFDINPCMLGDTIVPTRSVSSDDSSLVPCEEYINLAMVVTEELITHGGEQEHTEYAQSVSSSENSQTQTKTDHTYETLANTDIMEHSYESTCGTN